MISEFPVGCKVKWTHGVEVDGTVLDVKKVHGSPTYTWQIEWHNGAGSMYYSEREMIKNRIIRVFGCVLSADNPNSAFRMHKKTRQIKGGKVC